MKTLKNIFQEKKNLLSIFFTAGYPNLNDTTAIISELSKNNVDFIEVGLPYSDPLADGPTIQDSSQVALQNGMNLDIVFDQLKSIKDTNSTPLVLMGYLNQMLKYGEDKFCQACVDCGIETLILPDLPMIEYENHYQQLFKKIWFDKCVFKLRHILLKNELEKIDAFTEAFMYVVASSSITGAKGEISKQQIDYFERIKSMNLKSNLIIGFGISDVKTFNTACIYASGAIIGSAFIKHLSIHGTDNIAQFIDPLKS